MEIKHISDYRKKREDHYPSVKDQLDMLWHSMNEGSAAKIEPFYSSIKAVKDAFPKDANLQED